MVYRVFVEKKKELAYEASALCSDTVSYTHLDVYKRQVEDPSLIIYAAIRKLDNKLIVTNGDQTDTIYNAIKNGSNFTEALKTREFEPDNPNRCV